ncbi:MAG: family hydrolase [Verrucomicrobiaceae bacterium]|nr:family hydrolase [Verrucomicrobiaceae bacterium]
MLFIFDWDGTLLDSTGRIVDAMRAAAAELGIEVLSVEQVRNIIGLGLPEAIIALYPLLSVSDRELLQAAYSRHYVAADQQPCAWFPTVRETLHQLKGAGFTLAVATGKSRRGLKRVLEQLGMLDFFHATRCADETQSKPHPQMLHELVQELSVPLEHAVMIGDTEYDMAMAEAAGMARIGVSYGAHAAERLWSYRPELVMDEFKQLLTWQQSKANSEHRDSGLLQQRDQTN